jgi:hypothetical protein
MVSDAVSDLRLGILWKTTEKNGAPARNRTGICHLGNGRSIHLSYGSNKSAAKITEFAKAYKFGSVRLGI